MERILNDGIPEKNNSILHPDAKEHRCAPLFVAG